MKRWLLILALPALLAAGPAPLVVGSVRDQYGAPIAGAQVSGGGASTQTDGEGTFALPVSGIASVAITCAYCVPLSVAVTADEPLVAIVRRYDALAQQSPSRRDIASLPYTRAESIASLRPFTVLENSSQLLPGARISDRALSSRGALVLDNGIPLYDIATNQSPFVAFPAYALQSVNFLPPSDAFTYGDLAGGGALVASTHGDSTSSGVAAAGDESAVRFGQTLDRNAWMAALSHDPQDTRARADASIRIPSGDDTFAIDTLAASDRAVPDAQHDLSSSLGGVRATFDSIRQNHVRASFTADSGGYSGGTATFYDWAKWSDVQAQGGVETTARIQFFADAAVRASSGSYWTSSAFLPMTAGTVAQTRVDAGAQTTGDRYTLRAGAGAYGLHYSGGGAGGRATLDGGLVTPDFFGSYAFDPHWTLEVQGGASFSLPTVLEAFVYPLDALELDRNTFAIGTLRYGDLRRFQAALTAAAENVRGLDVGTIHSAGVSLAWQVAPALALRAWFLHANDTTQPYDGVYRFGVHPRPATAGSYWLTYDTGGLRIDAIYRQDLLDYRSDPHFDASLSVPLHNGLSIFASTQRRAGTRYVTAGLRLDSL